MDTISAKTKEKLIRPGEALVDQEKVRVLIPPLKNAYESRFCQEAAKTKPRALIDSKDPQFLHVKDPVVFDSLEGDTIAIFCTYPFSWTSANTGFALRTAT